MVEILAYELMVPCQEGLSCRGGWGLKACTSATAASSTAASSTAAPMPSQAIVAAPLHNNNMSGIQPTAQSEM